MFPVRLKQSGLRGAVLLALLTLGTPALAADRTSTVVVAQGSDVLTLDPMLDTSPISINVFRNIFDALTRIAADGSVTPLLAESWKWESDTTLDMNIRKGVKFHSGKELDAEDVAYTLNFIVDTANGSLNRSYLSWIKKVEVLDKYKVRLLMDKPFPTALTFLAGAGNILPKGHYDKAPARADAPDPAPRE